MIEAAAVCVRSRVPFAPHRMGQTLADAEQSVKGVPVKRGSVNSPRRDQVQTFLREPHHSQGDQESEHM